MTPLKRRKIGGNASRTLRSVVALKNPFFWPESVRVRESRILSLRQDPETVLPTLTPNNYFSDKAPITFAKPDRVSADIGLFAIRSRSISAITFGSGLSDRRAQALPS